MISLSCAAGSGTDTGVVLFSFLKLVSSTFIIVLLLTILLSNVFLLSITVVVFVVVVSSIFSGDIVEVLIEWSVSSFLEGGKLLLIVIIFLFVSLVVSIIVCPAKFQEQI